ncbi:MAG TPA: SIMPL domain-containing protein [Acidisoma sp.]|uniref:SIMPL domain-containing protein n=1 Tax=Acidisoma sp. TaxID=1872115 RepID=UPI002C7137A2|nr:SIMPL domain-containing protein [Acidisoma sp.]HTI02019.1 SIMPL domain-containing protein [Acidisoma sp.]
MRHAKLSLGTALLTAGLFSCAAAARADTLLHLSVTASVTAMPDELVAELSAEVQAASAGAAQAAVNDMIAKALGAAQSIPTIAASTTTYSVWHQTDPKDVWQASQGMMLRAHDGAALLALVGQLQQDGLAVGNLSWQLSPTLAEKTYEQAMAKAIDKLTAQAAVVAKLLHLQPHGFSSVTVGNDSQPGPRPMMRMMATAAPEAKAPPSAQAEEQTVSATVSGEARLEQPDD